MPPCDTTDSILQHFCRLSFTILIFFKCFTIFDCLWLARPRRLAAETAIASSRRNAVCILPHGFLRNTPYRSSLQAYGFTLTLPWYWPSDASARRLCLFGMGRFQSLALSSFTSALCLSRTLYFGSATGFSDLSAIRTTAEKYCAMHFALPIWPSKMSFRPNRLIIIAYISQVRQPLTRLFTCTMHSARFTCGDRLPLFPCHWHQWAWQHVNAVSLLSPFRQAGEMMMPSKHFARRIQRYACDGSFWSISSRRPSTSFRRVDATRALPSYYTRDFTDKTPGTCRQFCRESE